MNTTLECGDTSNILEMIYYSIVPVTYKDREEVVQFLRKFYLRNEPLNAAVDLLHEPNGTCQEYEEYCINCIPTGLSIKAISSTGHLLGVCLNTFCTRDDYNYERDLLKNCKNPKFSKILRLIVTTNEQSNIFGLFPTIEEIFEILILSVDGRFQRQGIGQALLQKTKEIARDRNFPLIKADCTSHFSAKVFSRFGYQCVLTLKYDDYVNEEGEKIFDVDFPHTSMKTFIMTLKK